MRDIWYDLVDSARKLGDSIRDMNTFWKIVLVAFVVISVLGLFGYLSYY